MAKKPSLVSPEARRLIQTERRRVARQAARNAEERASQARQSLYSANNRKQSAERTQARESILDSLSALIKAVASSWGITTPLHLSSTSNPEVSAYTDFRSITVNYPTRMIPKSIEAMNADVMRSFIADLKGLAYHEVGHIRFTVPYPTLLTMQSEEVRATPDYATMGYHKVWNILEDQRMEAAVVAESPVIAGYFTTIVLRHMLSRSTGNEYPASQYLLIAGRRYLPTSVRVAARRKFEEEFGTDVCRKARTIINDYMVADDPEHMFRAVLDMHNLLDSLNMVVPDNVDSHYIRPASSPGGSAERQKIKDSASKDEGDEQDSGQQADKAPAGQSKPDQQQNGQSGDKADTTSGEEQGSTGQQGEQMDDQPDAGSTATPGGGSAGSDGEPDEQDKAVEPMSTESLKDYLQQHREEQLSKDRTIDDVLKDIYERANGDMSTLSRARGLGMQSDEMIVKAEQVASAMEDALRTASVDNAPIWQSRQVRGVIEPFTYRTRTSGSQEYRRLYTDRGDMGSDIAVTVLLDISGSMSGHDYTLGACAYACKKACDAMEIPCTVVLFNISSEILWKADDVASHVSISVSGGTSPRGALECLGEQRYGKKDHLVLIMSDGAFDRSFPGLHVFSDDGVWFAGLGLGFNTEQASYIAQSLVESGCHEAWPITDLMQVPDFLVGFLSQYLK